MRTWLVTTLFVLAGCSGTEVGPVFVDDEVRPTTTAHIVVPLTTLATTSPN